MKSGKETVLSGVDNVNEGGKQKKKSQTVGVFKLFFFHDLFINLMQLFTESW